MIEAASCPSLDFNIAATSGMYAQMAGVITGFGFAAIVWLLTPTQNRQRELEKISQEAAGRSEITGDQAFGSTRDSDLIMTLLAGFFALLFTTLMYSVLAGEASPQALGLAATQEVIIGLPFGLGVMMMFHGVELLIANGNMSLMAIWSARAVALLVIPVITMFLVVSGASDTLALRSSGGVIRTTCSGPEPTSLVGIVLTILLVVVLSLAVIAGHQSAITRSLAQKIQVSAPIVVMATSVCMVPITGFISTRGQNFFLSETYLNIYLVGMFMILAFVGCALLASGYPRPVMAVERPDSARGAERAVSEAPIDDQPMSTGDTDQSAIEENIGTEFNVSSSETPGSGEAVADGDVARHGHSMIAKSLPIVERTFMRKNIVVLVSRIRLKVSKR
jgi:hypothetical protein